MCKEMLVIPVSRVVDLKKNNRKKWRAYVGGGEAQGVADPPKTKKTQVPN
jgi:hypothetical protein